MKPPRPVVIAGGAVLVVALAVGSAAAFHIGPWTRQDPPVARDLGPVVATVDGDPIYLEEITSRVEGIASLHGSLEGSLGKDWQDKLLQNVVDDKIIEQQANALAITVTDEEVEQHLADLRGYFPSEAEFQQWLRDGRMDEAELASRIRLQTLASAVYLKVTDGVSVTKDDAKSWYEAHPDRYVGVDGETSPFFAVRDEVEKRLLKKAQDSAYAAWLDTRRGEVQVVVVMEDWWKEIA